MTEFSEEIEAVEFQGGRRPEFVDVLERRMDDPVVGDEARRVREQWSYISIKAASQVERMEAMEADRAS